jgi:TetR/AcrR family transcriptional regulator of autoinduction and epiphytic fitness
MSEKPEKIDGRVARKQRTKMAIADALLQLISEGDLTPTARRIAVRAGVSERSIFQHFPVLEELFRVAAERQFQIIQSVITPIDKKLDLDSRIALFVEERVKVLEILMPIRRAAILQEPFSREIAKSRHRMIKASMDEIAKIFEQELSVLEAKERSRKIVALDMVCSWNAWEHLRFQGYSVPEAKEIILKVVHSLF